MPGSSVGVFVGVSTPDAVEVFRENRDMTTSGGGGGSGDEVYGANSASNATAAGRVSFCFGWNGPCAAYDTACSSSLVALHAAAASLRAGECDLAVVAGYVAEYY